MKMRGVVEGRQVTLRNDDLPRRNKMVKTTSIRRHGSMFWQTPGKAPQPPGCTDPCAVKS
jgi:hypothetical protein